MNRSNLLRGVGLAMGLMVAGGVMAAGDRADYDVDDDGLIEIFDLADLDEMRNHPSGDALYGESAGCDTPCFGFELANDLDFDTSGNGSVDSADDYWNSGLGWEPISTFGAVLEGNGYTIANLYINRDAAELGLVGFLSGSIKNLALTGVSIASADTTNVGALVGTSTGPISGCELQGEMNVTGATTVRAGGLAGNSDGTITDCAVDITLTASAGRVFVGGITGFSFNYPVRDSSVTGAITAVASSAQLWAGGVVGFDMSGGASGVTSSVDIDAESPADVFVGGVAGVSQTLVETSSTSGTLTAISTLTGSAKAGGIVGEAGSAVRQSLSSATVIASAPDTSAAYAGGIVGNLGAATVSNLQATGDVTAKAGGAIEYAGGVVGYCAGCTMEYSYATGVVTGFYRGGVRGSAASETQTETYYDSDTSGLAGGNTTAELQCPVSPGDTGCSPILYSNWSDAIWDFGTNSQYPALIIGGTVTRDSDGDGVPDSEDAFPENPAASVDADDDGKPDAWNADCDATCQDGSGLTLDDEVAVSEFLDLVGSSGSADQGSVHWLGILLLGVLMARRERVHV